MLCGLSGKIGLQVSLLLGAIGNQAEIPEEGRSLAAVMLRRLFSSEFEEFFAKLPEEQKAALKAQIIVSVQQEPSKTVRRKCADLAAEVISTSLYLIVGFSLTLVLAYRWLGI